VSEPAALPRALEGIRVCDLTGQLAGAGATRTLAAFGAEVIRIEDPVRLGKWDILRGAPPFVDERRGNELGGAFNQHNVEKLGVTLNTRTERGRELLGELIAISDVVAENFSAEVLSGWGFSFERMQQLRPDVIYVSNCGFGHTGPYMPYRTWGPVVQAMCGLTFSSGLRGMVPAGWGYSYMDHLGANFGAFAILAALRHRKRTGEGQWIDLSTLEAGVALLGPSVLDHSVNGRGDTVAGTSDSNHNVYPAMAPHNIYPAAGPDEWIAIACRDDGDWAALRAVIDEPWSGAERWALLTGRLAAQDDLDGLMGAWTERHDKFALQDRVRTAGVPVAAVQTPAERIDGDDSTASWGLWPEVVHEAMGTVRVDGLPVHLSETDWHMARGAPLLGQHNDYVYGKLLGLSPEEIDGLRDAAII
jgi:benzylsuccinate CoA-transferase BbsF subunit